jgi:hypothetical protein
MLFFVSARKFGRAPRAPTPRHARNLSLILLTCEILTSCSPVWAGGPPTVTSTSGMPPSNSPTLPVVSPMASPTPAPTHTATMVPTATQAILNPLTGLPVRDPTTLARAPVLISVTEFPPTARPQAGLSLAGQVWETYIGQGMSRFLAIYYGDYLDAFNQVLQAHPDQPGYAFVVGPIRSGRVGWETIKSFYPQGLLVTRFASPEVATQLTNWVTVYARDPQDVNSAGLTLKELSNLHPADIDPGIVEGLSFSVSPPGNGQPAPAFNLFYNLYDQIRWVWDPARGQYLRYQDPADGSGDLHALADRLTGETVGADNVVVLFANHKYDNSAGTILEIDMLYKNRQRGLLFRDGRQYDIQWSSLRQQFSLQDLQGNPLQLKPGRTFFELVNIGSHWTPTTMSLRFYNPPAPTPVPTITLKPKLTESAPPSQTPDPPDGSGSR